MSALGAGEPAGGSGHDAAVAAEVVMYRTAHCPYCHRAEALLKKRGVTAIDTIRVDIDPARRIEMAERTGRRTVPQIFIGNTYVGGYDDLAELDSEGGLIALLAGKTYP